MDSLVQELAQTLRIELEEAIKRENVLATADYWFALGIIILTLLSSFLAGVLGLTGTLDAKQTAVLAFVPGALAAIATTLKLEPKSNWHYRKMYGFCALLDRLKYEMPSEITREHISAISREKRTLVEAMEKEWESALGLSWTPGKHQHQ